VIAAPAPVVPQALLEHRPLISGGLRRAVDRLAPDIRRMLAYHLGWVAMDGHEVDADGGKAIRPALTLLTAEAVGAPPERALPGAVALELVHNFSLIHDDVMDGDTERRHRPTVWARFGVGRAILAGDAALTLAQELLLEDRSPESPRAAAELARATALMIEGQADDVAFESRFDVSEDQVLAMTARKTGALLGCAGALGAILGGAPERLVDALRSFGLDLGLAFQAVDDVLGIWGDPAVTGKPAASDLRQRKNTIPVVHALRSTGPEARELAELLASGDLSDRRLARAAELLDLAGSRAWSLSLADRHLTRALGHLDAEGLSPGPVQDLCDVARFVVGRDF
jgi:geranylgeranyl diphosphate synthase type I